MGLPELGAPMFSGQWMLGSPELFGVVLVGTLGLARGLSPLLLSALQGHWVVFLCRGGLGRGWAWPMGGLKASGVSHNVAVVSVLHGVYFDGKDAAVACYPSGSHCWFLSILPACLFPVVAPLCTGV